MNMSDCTNIVCRKCGETAISKCPYCRNVFPKNQLATSVSNMITFDRDGQKLIVDVSYHSGENEFDKNVESALGTLLYYLGLLQVEDLPVVLCDHAWEFKPGEASTIGCGHGHVEKSLV
jgi:hypothetical protein